MDDLNEKLNAILSDPSAMEQVMALGNMLGLSGNQESTAGASPPPAPKPAAPAVSGMPDPQTMGMLMKFAPLLGSIHQETDSTRLLRALKPFLSERRRQRAEQAAHFINLIQLLPMLKGIMS